MNEAIYHWYENLHQGILFFISAEIIKLDAI